MKNFRRYLRVVRNWAVGRFTACWGWIKVNEVQLKVVFAITAGAFVLVEYSLKQVEAKVEKTLKYVERYNQFEVALARKKLDGFWFAKSAAEWRKILAADTYDSVASSMIIEAGLIGEVKVLGGFLQEVALCVNDNICAGKPACKFFFSDMQSFRHNYKWYIDEVEKNWKEPAVQAINQMLGTACPEDSRKYCVRTPQSPYCKEPLKA